MAKKEFLYKGKTLEQLQELSMEQLKDIFPSEVRRKINRGFTEDEKIFMNKIKVKDNVKTHARTVIILPFMVGKTVQVHRGNAFESVMIKPEMIGHKLGEYVLTRKIATHAGVGVGATRSSSSISVR